MSGITAIRCRKCRREWTAHTPKERKKNADAFFIHGRKCDGRPPKPIPESILKSKRYLSPKMRRLLERDHDE